MNQFCDCAADGFCPRYGREMGGRFRQICAGINCDLGTAAAFRAQWARERNTALVRCPAPCCKNHTWNGCPECGGTGFVDMSIMVDASPDTQVATDAPAGVGPTPKPMPILLKTAQAPGDAVAMTAAIYSLHKAHPGKYVTAVESYWPDVFAHNPDVAWHQLPGDTRVVPNHTEPLSLEMHYPAVHDSNERGIHFMQGWCEHLSTALNVSVPLLTNRPHLYLSPEPSALGKLPVGDYWLVCSGGKRDFTNKLWGHERYQAVVYSLKERVRFVQVGGAKPVIPWAAHNAVSQEDNHPALEGVVDMRGRTTLRDLFYLVRRARGVLCGVSLLMHVAAALERPAVVVAGGREPVAWNAYPLQYYLHTVGALPCSTPQGVRGGACWRSRTVPLGDGTTLDRDCCERPVDGEPECMTLINPGQVVDLILRYNGGG